MSMLTVERRRKKLRKYAAMAPDAEFLLMVWATWMLLFDRPELAARYLTFPPEAVNNGPGEPYSIHPWELETLVTQLMLTPRNFPLRGGTTRMLNCKQFAAIRQGVHLVRELEDAEIISFLTPEQSRLEMARIGHRQFPWQGKFIRADRVYRYLYAYGQGACAAHFKQQYGVSIDDFTKICFSLLAVSYRQPWSNFSFNDDLSVTQESVDAVFRLISVDIADAPKFARDVVNQAMQRGSATRTIYLPCFLRSKPIITNKRMRNTYIAPLPDLIINRMTSGLYYDLKGDTALINDANDRFEEYTKKIIDARSLRFKTHREQTYLFKKQKVKTPDILIEDGGSIQVVMELKASRLTIEAQYADDPFAAATMGYTQLAKAIVQLWKFFAHARNGDFSQFTVAPDCHAVLLTLDPWFQMSEELFSKAVAEATTIVAEKHPEVTPLDMRPVIVCHSQELDEILAVSDEGDFLDMLTNARDPQYSGWQLREVRRRGTPEKPSGPFPLPLSDVMPWTTGMRLSPP